MVAGANRIADRTCREANRTIVGSIVIVNRYRRPPDGRPDGRLIVDRIHHQNPIVSSILKIEINIPKGPRFFRRPDFGEFETRFTSVSDTVGPEISITYKEQPMVTHSDLHHHCFSVRVNNK